MTKLKVLGKDVLKSLLIGLALGIVFSLLLAIIGFITSKAEFYGTIHVMRVGLILVAAVGMLVVLLLFFMQRKSEEFDKSKQWKKHFNLLTVKTCILNISIVFALLASLADALLYI